MIVNSDNEAMGTPIPLVKEHPSGRALPLPEATAYAHRADPQVRLLAGWGRTSPSLARVMSINDINDLAQLLSSEGQTVFSHRHKDPQMRGSAAQPGVIARGLGRSYGDAAQSAGGIVIDTSNLDSIGVIDPITGSVEVGGGTSLDALINASMSSGWFIPVSPGTRQVTVGGAIAADVHGKNHHRDGSFCSYVTSLTLVTPVGIFTINPKSDPELFWATAGGMGLTGVIVSATLQLQRVETAWVEVDTERFDNLDDTMSAMEAMDHEYRFSVAWVDCNFHRGSLGRSILTRGDHAPLDALNPKLRNRPLTVSRTSKLRVPFSPPVRLVNHSTLRAFNELWFRKSPRRRLGELIPLAEYLHPLDGIADWNLLYGSHGFVQYQFAVAPYHAEVVRKAISMVAESGIGSSMAVLKRFGPGNPGPLSFPIKGWTLALDFPADTAGLPTLLDRLDEMVAAHSGRVYLAKDARLRPELLTVMYPRIGEFAAVLRRVDPDGILRSDLSRRLGIGRTFGS
jgi:decaprenylphospho-beta-D-ribofuranose 2-oxidase